MSATAVVIVVVLLASWAWYGGDDTDVGARTEVSVGDTMTYDYYLDDVLVYTENQTILDVEDGIAIVAYVYGDINPRVKAVDVGIAGVTVPTDMLGDVMGSETIDTPFGEKECQIMPYSYDGILYRGWFADNGVQYMSEYTENLTGMVIRIVLKETSLFDEAPTMGKADILSAGTPAVDDLYCQALVSFGTGGASVTNSYYDIDSIESGKSLIVYWSDIVPIDIMVMDTEEFASLWTAGGPEAVGTETVATVWGFVDATVTREVVDYGDGTSSVTTYWNDGSGAMVKFQVAVMDGDETIDTMTSYVIANGSMVLGGQSS